MKAAEAYITKYFEVEDLIADITKALHEHSGTWDELNADWGYVGDLGYVAEKLQEVRSFLLNEEAAE